MANNSVWLLAGVGIGVLGAGVAWWLWRNQGGDALVRQTIVHRNTQGWIEAVETTTIPQSGIQTGQTRGQPLHTTGDIEVRHDG